MKRLFWVSALFFFIVTLSFGEPFEDAVRFDIDLAALSVPSVAREAATDGRVVLLEGLMGDSIVEQGPDDIRVWVTLVGGAWIGTDDVKSYSCRIAFVGEKWLESFPDRRPKNPGPEYVPPGSRLLVAARVLGFDEGTGASLAEMVNFRVLD